MIKREREGEREEKREFSSDIYAALENLQTAEVHFGRRTTIVAGHAVRLGLDQSLVLIPKF